MSEHEHKTTVDEAEGPEPNPEDLGDPTPFPIFYAGVIGAISVVVSILFVTALYHEVERAEWREKAWSSTAVDAQRLADAQLANLNAPPRWIDKEKGVVGVPIRTAMQLVIRDAAAQAATQPARPAGP
jgi:hypothetical protein